MSFEGIRRADISDVPALAALEALVFPPAEYGADVLSAKRFRYLVTKGNAVILIAEQNGALGGYILLLFRRGLKTAKVFSLAVSPHMRGKGLGDALMAAAAAHCRESGYTRVMLETRGDNRKMQDLCARGGYKLLKKVSGYYHDGETALKFGLELAR
jgi:ribosomal protein S18 acetylase RimI-like enzyme